MTIYKCRCITVAGPIVTWLEIFVYTFSAIATERCHANMVTSLSDYSVFTLNEMSCASENPKMVASAVSLLLVSYLFLPVAIGYSIANDILLKDRKRDY